LEYEKKVPVSRYQVDNESFEDQNQNHNVLAFQKRKKGDAILFLRLIL